MNSEHPFESKSNRVISKHRLLPLKPKGYIAASYYGTLTLNRFHSSNSFVRGIQGPFGSSKSTACAMEILNRSLRMLCYPGTRKRRSKWAIIRATYPELSGTVLETWKKILPEYCMNLKLGNREQPSLTVCFRHTDGTDVEIYMQLFALDNPKQVDKLGSYEYTGAWINEAREIPKEIFDHLTGRVGRYPGRINAVDDAGNLLYDADGRPIEVDYWTGIIMDTNPPDINHWYYNLAEKKRPKGYEFFQQPPAVLKNLKTGEWVANPAAENIENLKGGYDYYFNQIAGKSDAWIRVYAQGRYGTSASGKPVYPMYDDKYHYEDTGRAPFTIYKSAPVLVGVDHGFNSAAVFAQFTTNGQLRVFDEIFVDNITTREFITDYIKPYIINNLQGFEVQWWGDPSGSTRESIGGSTAAMEYIRLGIPLKPAPTNLINPRIQSVVSFLTKKDGFKMSNKCQLLRMGFLGEYKFERILVSEERYREKPTKHHVSCHVMDSLSYITTSIDPAYSNRRFSKIEIQAAPVRWGA